MLTSIYCDIRFDEFVERLDKPSALFGRVYDADFCIRRL